MSARVQPLGFKAFPRPFWLAILPYTLPSTPRPAPVSGEHGAVPGPFVGPRVACLSPGTSACRASSCGSFAPIAPPLTGASCLLVGSHSLLENKARSRARSQSWSWLSFIKHSESTSFSVDYHLKSVTGSHLLPRLALSSL